MAKHKKNRSSGSRSSGMTAAEKQQAQLRAKEEAERAERNRKSRAMGMAFLYAFLALIGLFCLYTLIWTLFFPAKSVSELRTNYLFISMVAIPYLIAAAAVIVRWLRRKQREEASPAVRRSENLVFVVVLLAAAGAFGTQMYSARRDVSKHPVYVSVCEALQDAGKEVRPPEEVLGYRSMLETMSMDNELRCGETGVVLHYHNSGAFIAGRFRKQVGVDYAGVEPVTEQIGGVSCSVWPAAADGEPSRTAICAPCGGQILILEAVGPEAEALTPVLKDCVLRILGAG